MKTDFAAAVEQADFSKLQIKGPSVEAQEAILRMVDPLATPDIVELRNMLREASDLLEQIADNIPFDERSPFWKRTERRIESFRDYLGGEFGEWISPDGKRVDF